MIHYLKSLCTRILTLTLLPFPPSLSLPHPSLASAPLVSTTMSRTSSRLSISAAPRVAAQAHDCGHPQLRSTPLAEGATRVAARESSWGSLAPN